MSTDDGSKILGPEATPGQADAPRLADRSDSVMAWKCPDCGTHNYGTDQCWRCSDVKRGGIDAVDHYSWRQVYAACDIGGGGHE